MSDPEYRRLLIDWGYRQIDVEYPPRPGLAPLNPVRRKLAIMAWERVIRTSGSELRAIVAGQAVDELRFQLQRRQNEILAEDAEQRRRRAVTFDTEVQTKTFDHMTEAQQRTALETMREQHRLAQEAEDAASRRRIAEVNAAADQEIARLIIEACLKAAGSTSAEETIRATRLVNEEISRIRRDAGLTPDEQHLHIKTLLDTLPTIMRNMRAHDV
jgi:hypothetical protein